ncbi:MAG TPA: Gfo/Idh/MocA family oxidoreductase [Bryobacteraceae bacterium]|nr:Gfo/Idh/MocA family oxidoreductase [Bryobacteraceae bacterium]
MAAASYNRVIGANDKVALGLVGSGRQGNADWKWFVANSDVAPLAVADVYQPNLENGLSNAGGQATGYKDFRRLLERKDLDAVVVATPDHWHALATVLSCEAGKDVYCEKPLSLTIHDGQAMVAAAKKSGRIVQVGSQQRSGPHYQKAVEIVRSGGLGKVAHVSASMVRNALPGVGQYPDAQPPADLDWDMWLGPAPYKPYNKLRCLYNFRWFWDYSGGQMTNMGAHDLDIARWALDSRGPVAVAGFGGRLCLQDGGETPDVQEVIFQFPGGTVVTWSVREMNAAPQPTLVFHGTKGTLAITRSGYQIKAEHWGNGPNREPQTEDSSMPGNNNEQHRLHIRHFIDCVKNRKRPISDVEDGHLTAVMCHLGNIATRLGRSVRWDSENERILGDPEANQWLARPYRAPWKLPKQAPIPG